MTPAVKSIVGLFDKLDDIVYESVKMVTDWTKEPLKRMEHNREKQKLELEAELQRKKLELENELQRIMMDKELEIALKNDTEKERIFMIIDQERKDRELERQKAFLELISQFETRIIETETNSIKEFVDMELELVKNAINFFQAKIDEYTEEQKLLKQELREDLKSIMIDFSDDAEIKKIMMDATQKTFNEIFDNAKDFENRLKNYLDSTVDRIRVFSTSGQEFIQGFFQKDKYGNTPLLNNENHKLLNSGNT